MQATRKHILDYIASQRSASAHELSRAFGMTTANLRHHLAVLQDQGFVEVIGLRSIEGRGRPEHLFGLGSQAKPENTADLAAALLIELSATDLPIRRSARLKRLAKRLGGPFLEGTSHITQRLVAARQRLDKLGYRPSWEARTGGPELVLDQCPYASIIAQHPELCKMDAYLMEGMLGGKVSQKTKLQPGPDGLPQCVFQVNGDN